MSQFTTSRLMSVALSATRHKDDVAVAGMQRHVSQPILRKESQTLNDKDLDNSDFRELISLFPHDFPRKTQIAALHTLASMFEEGSKFSIIEAPTGSGKSAIALTAARYSASLNDDSYEPGAYILTPTNNLATQMAASFTPWGLATLKGRQHYGAASSGVYDHARKVFFDSRLSVTNYAYFMRAQHLPERQMLILDEGHNLEKILLNSAGFTIPAETLKNIGLGAPPRRAHPWKGNDVTWLRDQVLPALRTCANRHESRGALQAHEDLSTQITEYLDYGDHTDWIAWTDDEHAFNVKPLSLSANAQELFTRAKHVVIQSATIFDFRTFRRVLGIPDDALVFSAPSDFPLENRPIIYNPVGDMAVSSLMHTLPRLCIKIEMILSKFAHSKGVIHTHSYQINRRVTAHLADKYGYRIITHGQSFAERERAIHRHITCAGPSVLISPSLTEGLDLKDDLARFQVVCKVPYPRLDAYTRARSARDRAWYELQTAWALVQMIGRAVRSEADSATTFVLDSQFEKFVARNEGILPTWWRAAIRKTEKAA
jgi:ATP-dependent DNA helicase DinG